jgi:uncharacterized protein
MGAMSEQTNTRVVQQTYEALGRGDIPALLALLTDDVEWVYQGPDLIPFAGTRRGQKEVGEFFSLLADTLTFEQFVPREFVEQGDTVVVIGDERSRFNTTGHVVEQEWVHVYTFRDDKIAKLRSFENTAAFVKALTVS